MDGTHLRSDGGDPVVAVGEKSVFHRSWRWRRIVKQIVARVMAVSALG